MEPGQPSKHMTLCGAWAERNFRKLHDPSHGRVSPSSTLGPMLALKASPSAGLPTHQAEVAHQSITGTTQLITQRC